MNEARLAQPERFNLHIARGAPRAGDVTAALTTPAGPAGVLTGGLDGGRRVMKCFLNCVQSWHIVCGVRSGARRGAHGAEAPGASAFRGGGVGPRSPGCPGSLPTCAARLPGVGV